MYLCPQSKATGDALPGVVSRHRLASLGQLQEQAAGLPVRHVRQEFLVFRLYMTGQGEDRGLAWFATGGAVAVYVHCSFCRVLLYQCYLVGVCSVVVRP